MCFHAKLAAVLLCASVMAGCGAKADGGAASHPSAVAAASPVVAPLQGGDDAPPAEKTGGFDGKRAFAQVVKQVGFGPRPSGSAAIGQLQEYLQSELRSYGCQVDVDAFSADTPVGRLAMKNIVAKVPGEKPGIILLATHYDTKLMPNFVGADDAGSSTAVMLELARLLCGKRGADAVWITFFDGEEAMKEWSDTDSRYGSRQMAAKMAMSGDLRKVKALLLADIVGTHTPHFKRESDSTKWLVDLVWNEARKLGYANIFIDEAMEVSDDHDPFLKRNVPSVDVIDLQNYPGGDLYYWHTPQDTLDKISAKSLAITGHVFLESVKQLQSR
ncbi:MAG TPA: M28 family peptidase [Candidatus Acidoferrum sp.]|nr:M28 family peptidase [Candidatus Acidoferrum sp.]